MSLIRFARGIIGASQQLSRTLTQSYVQRPNLSLVRCASTKTPEEINKILMEFFDDKKNFNENEVKHGRSWLLPELRIKSNTDLHKLWYILLKEKNMLLTMQHECKEEHRLFPSPERLDKVNESMSNLESVVRERNQAYHLLETGVDGERPKQLVNNQLGMKFYYRSFEHVIPYWMNVKWRENHKFRYGGYAVRKFLRKYREKLWNEKRKVRNRERNEVMNMMKRNPELDRESLQQKYPSVNIDRLVKLDKIRGHYVPKI